MKPRVFIGSSSENLEIAYAVQENLDAVAEVTVWTQTVFNPSRYNLESLADALFETDFGIFVFAPNDVTSMRGQDRQTASLNGGETPGSLWQEGGSASGHRPALPARHEHNPGPQTFGSRVLEVR